MTEKYASEYIAALEAMYNRKFSAESRVLIIASITKEPNQSALKALDYLDKMLASDSKEAREYRNFPIPAIAIRLVREQSGANRDREAEKQAAENRQHKSAYDDALRDSGIGREVMASLNNLVAGGRSDQSFIDEARRLHVLYPTAGFDVVADNRRVKAGL